MQKKRELEFLTYLDALEKGDAEGISAFLALAEADAELEKMMMDYHKEESPLQDSKVITPLKRKREDVNRWWRRFGNGLVAAILMAVVGTAGIFIGATGFEFGNTSADSADVPNGGNPVIAENGTNASSSDNPRNIFCDVEITSEDNTVMLIKDGDIDRSMTVGVNNPFIIIPSSGRASSGYSAIFEGLRVTIAKSSVSFPDECERLSSMTVYPKDNRDGTCSIAIDHRRLSFPIEQYAMDMSAQGYTPYSEPHVLLEAPVDGAYPIHNLLFSGNVPSEFVELTGECTSFPLLYIQHYEQGDSLYVSDAPEPTIEIETLRVWEQKFERGTMLYLEQMNVVWIACDAGEDAWVSWLSLPAEMPLDVFSQGRGNPPEDMFLPQARFIGPWEFVTFADTEASPICDLGWATSTSVMNQNAPYHYENGVHSITTLEGDTYSFHANAEIGTFSWSMSEQ
jgi:hypothetical protein